ncbi:carbohydrate-binding protein [Spirosoma sp. HMF4905]|uniref:Carbohydrate-binding protein n=1 Tax=Spirosoma arboris TaxID=2682092 RepID=A0A7K1SLT6_9BACT|nr:PQQ-dependent sugar dehydrogenase [Spirosoma arboris]MVM34757.1 carbohydrate-binding protein [Spirosoma arboris]
MQRLASALTIGIALIGLWAFSFVDDARLRSNLFSGKPPEENRFTKVIVADKLDEPMALTTFKDGRVLFIERKGKIHLFRPATGQIKLIATIPVSTKYTSSEGKVSEAEDGLLGVVQDPQFEQNHWLYLYYSPEGSEPKNILARYELRGDALLMESRKVLLEIPTQREQCCHTGGGMVFDDSGNLYLATGDNTSPRVTGYTPIDERPGRSPWDAQKSSANTNDLRGKIIRVHPNADGPAGALAYTIPEGNLFAKGMPKTRPEIYVMGLRNPWRLSIDSKTGYLYWGEVGPDMRDSVTIGPNGYDDFNQARAAGNFGWPYFVGDNAAYWDRDFATGKSGERFDPAKPVNNSPNNTGLTQLPPAQGAFIWYSYGASEKFPLMGSGGRSAVGGPIFHKADFKNAPRLFPDYYEGKWFITDFIRGWIMAVTMDEKSNYVSMERFLPSERFDSPIDMKFAADGDLYLLEYGSAWFRGNDNARLVRIEYNGGNRKPVVQVSADKTGGSIPLQVSLSSKGTKDYDGDALTYQWTITSKNGQNQTVAGANPTITLDKAGIYTATLTVSDAKGDKNSKSLELTAGNEPPSVSFAITKGNKTFFFPGKTIDYTVDVTDKEDGSLADGRIASAQVAVNINYVPESFDKVELAAGHRYADATANLASTAKQLMAASDCRACHTVETKSVGPAYKEIAEKYKSDRTASERLAKKVIAGGNGVWGESSMSAHPGLSIADATQIVNYILSLSEDKAVVKALPAKGSYTTTVPMGESAKGSFVLRAAYTDKGNASLPASIGESVVVLRSSVLAPETADESKSTEFITAQGKSFYVVGSGAYLGYHTIDLGGINQIDFMVQASPKVDAAGGTIEVRLDSPTGKLIGETPLVEVRDPARSIASIKATITPTEGFHTLFFVFKNTRAKSNQILMRVSAIQFVPDESTLR